LSDDDPLAALAGTTLTSEELLLITRGMTPEQAAAEVAEHTRIRSAAEKIQGKPILEWPPFEVKWDLSPTSYFHALDGGEPAHIKPGELELFWTSLEALDRVLQAYNLRTLDEVWAVGAPSKAARAIVHWSEGRLMTPVWVTPTAPGKLGIVGGNHRLAVARAKRVKHLPLLIRTEELATVLELLPRISPPKVVGARNPHS
jgi:hypothetical protein